MPSHIQGMFFAAPMLLAGASPLQAQQADNPPITQTPPELRDFRLDPPPPAAQGPEQRAPLPSERPANEPPQAQPSPMQDREPDATGETASAPIETASSANRNERSAATDGAAPTAAPADARISNAPEGLEQDRAPDSIPPSVQPATQIAAAPPEAVAWWPWAVGGSVLLAALIIAGLIARRRGKIVPLSSRAPKTNQSARQMPPPTPAALPPPQPVPAIGQLSASFAAETAQLSIASLTVTGTVKVRNDGAAPLTGIQLRSLMISAQAGQENMAIEFHDGNVSGDVQPLGGIFPGEQIDARLEFRLPREELASFRWSEREFVAPILLINVRSDGASGTQEVRLSQLIGRANTEPAARLKPLAIDRGPRRFQPIAARPVFG